SYDEELVEQGRCLRSQARDDAPHYQHSRIGYNYRMSNIVAGIGRGQMKVLPDRVSRRRDNFTYYQAELATVAGMAFPEEPEGMVCNRRLPALTVDPEKTGGVPRQDIRLTLHRAEKEPRPLSETTHTRTSFQ